ncbi:hypothetical protein C1646_13615 [Rhizophagus diaphanus]|nr:hypothetical protein C1646_13615 [Rhizophagus diaphanus] [Rhizophagus sp. MUCL 43196]
MMDIMKILSCNDRHLQILHHDLKLYQDRFYCGNMPGHGYSLEALLLQILLGYILIQSLPAFKTISSFSKILTTAPSTSIPFFMFSLLWSLLHIGQGTELLNTNLSP